MSCRRLTEDEDKELAALLKQVVDVTQDLTG